MNGSEDCVFCRIVAREIPAKIVYENERLLAFEDIKPQAPLHVLIIPKEHIARLSDLDATRAALTGEMVLAAKEIAGARVAGGAGYRIVLNCGRDAGQEVFHLHAHILGGRKFAWPPG